MTHFQRVDTAQEWLDPTSRGTSTACLRLPSTWTPTVWFERLMAAATDFSEQRPELWPNISRELWQLHNRGPNWAEATQGSPAVWAIANDPDGR